MTDLSAPLLRTNFPPDFLFGVATSAYQIEGHGAGGAGPTHWDSFAATPGNVVNQENGARACDHVTRYREDLALAAGMGCDVYRFSTSWARLLPQGQGAPNPEGIAFYDQLIDTMLEHGLRPAATLYHWELPSALADRGGWANRDIAARFAEFADLVARYYGDRLWSVAPINEPYCVTWLSHFLGHHAPGLRDIRAASRAVHHVLLAHGRAIEALRAAGVNRLGAVVIVEDALPASARPEDQKAAARQDAIYNRMFLTPLFHGTYPEQVLEGLPPHLPARWQDDMATIQAPLDWLGVNFYTCARVAWTEGAWPNIALREGTLEKTATGWEVRPASLARLLRMIHTTFTGDLPLYITENGLASEDVLTAGWIDDGQRLAYVRTHLNVVREALADGVPLKGHMIWSLLDNYEWALGYGMRFGLVHVDFDTLVRTPKASYHALKAFLKEGAEL